MTKENRRIAPVSLARSSDFPPLKVKSSKCILVIRPSFPDCQDSVRESLYLLDDVALFSLFTTIGAKKKEYFGCVDTRNDSASSPTHPYIGRLLFIHFFLVSPIS